MRVSAVQLCSGARVDDNLAEVQRWVAEAAHAGASVVVLPENFAYLGTPQGRREHAEDLDRCDGPIARRLAALAMRHGVWLVAGAMAERSADGLRPYATCPVFAPDGRLVARYRKIHLFDVDLGDGIDYAEPVATSAGAEPVVVDLGGLRVGLSVCYDLRFPELYRRLAAAGAEWLAVVAAFTLTTGKDHWTVLLQARAIENQAYVVAAGQWGRHGERVSYGHSCVIDPWGTVVAQAAERPGVVTAELDREYLAEVRRRLPALHHRRLEG